MKAMKLTTTVLAAALVAAGTISLFAQQGVFRSGTRIVPLYATVTDAKKRLVPDLTKTDFEILDNEKLQEMQLFENEVQPITVIVMLDTSASMMGNMDLLKHASEQFVLRLLPKDRGMVGAFNDKIQFLPAAFTGNRDELVRSLGRLDYGNPTRLFDAIHESIAHLKSAEGRRVVLVFTDGDDTYSSVGANTILDEARNDEVMIYAVGFHSDYFNGSRQVHTKPDSNLKRFAEETGGGYFELDKSSDLAPTFTRVASELHSQYVLGFTPAVLDGKIHRVLVRVKRPGMIVRARKSYLAAAETTAK
jgi:Ca-activated chloride channel family protein